MIRLNDEKADVGNIHLLKYGSERFNFVLIYSFQNVNYKNRQSFIENENLHEHK